MVDNELIQFLSSKTWRIERGIVDRKFGLWSTFSGQAHFSRGTSFWVYEELGQLHSHGRLYTASRQYLYEPDDQSVAVRFEDGRPFYSIDCRKLPVACFEHLCGLDRYVGELSVRTRSWRSIWGVTGPSKDLEICSEYY